MLACSVSKCGGRAQEKLIEEALRLLFDEPKAAKLRDKIAQLARPEAANDIVNEIEKLIQHKD
jgi:UDP-N-acetylglucosamine--N-acetylmuramyl-(pentapeptide) pyrophosphoryl-undecaprenol N-acetylglucosamine transferase